MLKRLLQALAFLALVYLGLGYGPAYATTGIVALSRDEASAITGGGFKKIQFAPGTINVFADTEQVRVCSDSIKENCILLVRATPLNGGEKCTVLSRALNRPPNDKLLNEDLVRLVRAMAPGQAESLNSVGSMSKEHLKELRLPSSPGFAFFDCDPHPGKGLPWKGVLAIGDTTTGQFTRLFYAMEPSVESRGLSRVPPTATAKHVPLPPSRPTEIATTITPALKPAPVPAKVVAPLPAPAAPQPVQVAEPAKPVAPVLPSVTPPTVPTINITIGGATTTTNVGGPTTTITTGGASITQPAPPATVPAVQSPPVPQPAPATTASITPPAKPAPTLIPPTAESDFGGGIGVEPVPKQ